MNHDIFIAKTRVNQMSRKGTTAPFQKGDGHLIKRLLADTIKKAKLMILRFLYCQCLSSNLNSYSCSADSLLMFFVTLDISQEDLCRLISHVDLANTENCLSTISSNACFIFCCQWPQQNCAQNYLKNCKPCTHGNHSERNYFNWLTHLMNGPNDLPSHLNQ